MYDIGATTTSYLVLTFATTSVPLVIMSAVDMFGDMWIYVWPLLLGVMLMSMCMSIVKKTILYVSETGDSDNPDSDDISDDSGDDFLAT